MERREFLVQSGVAGLAVLTACSGDGNAPLPTAPPAPPPDTTSVFQVKAIPNDPFTINSPNLHTGVEALLQLMATNGLRFYQSAQEGTLKGPYGLIAANDVVLVKVNAQWKYRGCTNSDVVRGLIQRILNHPDGFTGEVVIFENGQGRGSLNCDTSSNYDNPDVHANATDERHSFVFLVDQIFKNARVSAYLLDPIRNVFITDTEHVKDGYRKLGNVSYPCFTTKRGTRVELKEGIWTGSGHAQNLKLISVPVLKTHEGSEMTGATKHMYGVLSMSDRNSTARHYTGLGEACARMFATVRAPVLNLLDCIWVSHASLKGYPESATRRCNQLLASQDPVALDTWATKDVLYPISQNTRHAPTAPAIVAWMDQAISTIAAQGGLYAPDRGIYVRQVTRTESAFRVFTANAS